MFLESNERISDMMSIATNAMKDKFTGSLLWLLPCILIASSWSVQAQDPGCIGFGSAPADCQTGCADQSVVCGGSYPLIRECASGSCASGNLSYCWLRRRPGENDFSLIPGADAAEYQVTAQDIEGKTGLFQFRRALACDMACNDLLFDEVSIQVSNIQLSTSAQPTEICKGMETTLQASALGGAAPYSFTWSNGLGMGQSVKASPQATIDYTVTVTDVNQCSAIGSVKVSVFSPSLGGQVVEGHDTVCASGSTGTLKLNGHLGTVLYWQRRNNNGAWSVIAHTAPSYEETLPFDAVWEYRVAVRNGPCDTTFSSARTIVATDRPKAPSLTTLPSDLEVCEGLSLSVTALGGSPGPGTCSNHFLGSIPGIGSFPLDKADPRFDAKPGTNALLAFRTCSLSGCSAKDTSRVEWKGVSDPKVNLPPVAPERVCFEGSAGPLSLTASGGTPALTYGWEYKDPSQGWLPVSDGTPSQAVYASPDKANGFTVSGIDQPGEHRYRVRVKASGKGCDETFGPELGIVWSEPLDPSFKEDGISKVGGNWTFELLGQIPASTASILQVYNSQTLVDTDTFSGALHTYTLPLAAQGFETRFCVSRMYVQEPRCMTDTLCSKSYVILEAAELAVQLDMQDPLSDHTVCRDSITRIRLFAKPNEASVCNPPLIKKHTLHITGNSVDLRDSVLQLNFGNITHIYDFPAQALPPGEYTAIGCAYQDCNNGTESRCDTLTFHKLPAILPVAPSYSASEANGLDLDMTDRVLCPGTTYIPKGSLSFTFEGKPMTGSQFLFTPNAFGTGSDAKPISIPLTYKVNGGCLYKDTALFQSRPYYDLVEDRNLCVGDSDTLSVPNAFSQVTWKRNGFPDGSGNTLTYLASDNSTSYQIEYRVRAERDGCAYRDTVHIEVVKVSGRLLAWPDSTCADGIYRVALNDGVVVEGVSFPPGWTVHSWSPQLYQTLSRPSPGSFIVRLKGKDLECRDSILLQLPVLPQVTSPLDTLYHDRCATTLLAPEGCPSGTGSWYRIHRITGELDTLSDEAPAYWRNVPDEDAEAYLYLFHCSTPCAQVAGLREIEENDGPPCPESERTALRIVPNPSSGEALLEVKHKTTGDLRLQLVDLTGRSLYDAILEYPGGTSAFGLELSALPSGAYFLMIRFPSGETQTEKLILHR